METHFFNFNLFAINKWRIKYNLVVKRANTCSRLISPVLPAYYLTSLKPNYI